jgi:hypothetical protein
MLRSPRNFNRQPHEKHELFVKNSRFIRDVHVVRGEFSFQFLEQAHNTSSAKLRKF